MKRLVSMGWFLALFFAAITTGVASPTTINYQGRLTSVGGVAVTGQISVSFSFWDAATGGNQLGAFYDMDLVTPDVNGIFTTEIGDDPLLPIPESLFAGSNVWLNVAINGENLAPRKRFSAVGYALNSTTVRGGDVGRMEFTAAEAISAGSIVLLKDDGTVRRAAFSGSDSLTTLSATFYHPSSVLIAPNKMLLVGSGCAMAISFDAAGGSIQTGSPQQYVVTQDGTDPISQNVLKLADNKALIMFNDASDSFKAKGVIATVSGLTVSLSPAMQLSSLNTIPAATLLDANRLFIVSGRMVQVATLAGDTITTGTETAISLSSEYMFGGISGPARCCLLNTDKVLVTCNVSSAFHSAVAVVATVNGTVITLEPMVTFCSTLASPSTYDIAQLRTDQAITAIYPSSFNSSVQTLSVSATTLTVGPATNLGQNISSLRISQIAALNDHKFYYNLNSAGIFGTVTDNNVAVSNPITLSENTINAAPVRLSDDSVLVAYHNIEKGHTYLRVVSDAADGPIDFSQRIGVAETSVNAGEACLVTIPGGITGHFSGLVPGKDYYVTETGLSQTGTNLIGHALTPNKLQVWR